MILLVRGPDENVHEMLATDINQSSDGAAVNDVNPAALQLQVQHVYTFLIARTIHL
jgi:hypothetical protein